ncbi:MAG: efflux RND transporter periplasmic adaptor subunit [Candidatus Sumerlaeota bacterium]|nr:efflux RND transporter periplasmic adaptor subunit [Candidatus Sumerlaeota bacterium]
MNIRKCQSVLLGALIACALCGSAILAAEQPPAGAPKDDCCPPAKITSKEKAAAVPAAKIDEHGHAAAETADKQPAAESAHKHVAGETTDTPSKEASGHADEVVLTTEALRQSGIIVEPVSQRSGMNALSAHARVSFNHEAMAHVGTPVEGRIIEMRKRLGDAVRQGDVLAVLASPVLAEAQGDYLQKRAALGPAQTATEAMKKSHDRARQAGPGEGISLTEFQKRESEWKQAEGNFIAAETALRATEKRLRVLGMSADQITSLAQTGGISPNFELRAPIAGEIVERDVTLGEMARPDKDKLFVIADLSVVWVMADVPESHIPFIQKGSAAKVKVSALEEHEFDGTVSYIARSVDSRMRTAQVRVELRNSPASLGQSDASDRSDPSDCSVASTASAPMLRPGMFAQVLLTAPMKEKSATNGGAGALAIPENAILTVEGAPAVFVAVEDEPGAFVKRNVQTAPARGGLAPVISGLKEGERIVTQGAFILKAELAKGEMQGKSCSGH